jgi:hypothetical protein
VLQFFSGAPQKNPYTGKMHREGIEMIIKPGRMDSRAIKKFVTDHLPNLVQRITAKVSPTKQLMRALDLRDRVTERYCVLCTEELSRPHSQADPGDMCHRTWIRP